MTTYGVDQVAPSDLQRWLVERVAEYLPDLGEAVDPTRQLGEYGLDSIAVVAFAADVEEQLGIAVDPTAIWDYPSVGELAEHLAAELAERRPQAA
ncbi:acyl carrier protein [Streptomyces lydicus]|uniref:acyl carrier protein n=1 Tax=Streptomyces lydicus TaxID=47763 RepID=UPI00101283A1|nr:acyl carrier protein [Streptomyces lydicus]